MFALINTMVIVVALFLAGSQILFFIYPANAIVSGIFSPPKLLETIYAAIPAIVSGNPDHHSFWLLIVWHFFHKKLFGKPYTLVGFDICQLFCEIFHTLHL